MERRWTRRGGKGKERTERRGTMRVGKGRNSKKIERKEGGERRGEGLARGKGEGLARGKGESGMFPRPR